MRPPEDYYFLWAVKGFDGLVGLIRKALEAGHRPPQDFIDQLKEKRDQINSILEKL